MRRTALRCRSSRTGHKWSYVYDEEKKTVELTERNGSRVVYVHDDKYRDIKHIHSNGEERFAYNQNNQKTVICGPPGGIKPSMPSDTGRKSGARDR